MNYSMKAKLNEKYGRVGQPMDEAKVTLKLDRKGRLCAWYGNVQNRIEINDEGHLVVKGEGALARLEGRDKHEVWQRLSLQVQRVLLGNSPVVLNTKECFK